MRGVLNDTVLRNALVLGPAHDLPAYLKQGNVILEHLSEFNLKNKNADSKELSLV